MQRQPFGRRGAPGRHGPARSNAACGSAPRKRARPSAASRCACTPPSRDASPRDSAKRPTSRASNGPAAKSCWCTAASSNAWPTASSPTRAPKPSASPRSSKMRHRSKRWPPHAPAWRKPITSAHAALGNAREAIVNGIGIGLALARERLRGPSAPLVLLLSCRRAVRDRRPGTPKRRTQRARRHPAWRGLRHRTAAPRLPRERARL